ncbi:MAG: DUF6599 family protein [Acidobacteriota bacterium]|nr:DUF6599 family protein [Acidobacteriota bacterium]
MPKLNLLFHLNITSIKTCFAALCLLPLLAIGSYAQQTNSKPVLPEKLGETWRASSPVRTLSAEQCAVLPDGDVYKEFWLESMVSRHYTNRKDSVTVEVFRMQFDSGAYGLFTFNRNKLAENRSEFLSGRYLVSLTSETTNSAPQDLLQTLKENLNSSNGELPLLPSHLPSENKIADSEIYLVGSSALARLDGFSDLKDVVNFSGGTEVAFAKYRNGNSGFNLLLVEYHTPQLATDGETQFHNYFSNLPEQERNQRLLKRIGNYIVLTTKTEDLPSAEKIISQIKYTPAVYWEGKKMSHIPLAYRPPDPFALEEMSQTAQVILRTFYWVGIMLFVAIILGFISGWTYFYWNRYRRSKFGYDNLYSDAGGSVRLNLDEYLLPPGDPATSKRDDDENLRSV